MLGSLSVIKRRSFSLRISPGLFGVVFLLAWLLWGAFDRASAQPAPAPLPVVSETFPAGLSAADRQQIAADLASLAEKLNRARDLDSKTAAGSDLWADAGQFHKGVVWALRYETNLPPRNVLLLKKSLQRGLQRADALLAKESAWPRKRGKLLRGCVSAVDGSTQPYGVIVPAGYDGSKPMRLDVVLHGSSRPVGLSELRFGARFDDGDSGGQAAPEQDYIELHPLGRVENCYRWAGETDVFEAIEAVCRNYRIDRDRIVLRGMSMGASGTWHLGLKRPDRFVAIGPYCGYVDTHRFSETPLPNFIKVGPLPPHQESALHMLDSVDYAANAGVVPAIAAIGEKDVFFQAHVIMGEAFTREGLAMVNLISPGTGHVIDPVTHREQMRRIGEHAAKGLDHAPRHLRFVTWTLKYNRCHWLEILALGKHYERAEFEASIDDAGVIEIKDPRNITRFAIRPPLPPGGSLKARIGGVDVPVPDSRANDAEARFVFALKNGKWVCLPHGAEATPTGKRPGLQGPIDDAFTAPFLAVRGTGKPWNPQVGAWADANLRRFAYEWARYMRGDLPVKNDTEVTDADLRDKNLILFGDPGSNLWIRKALKEMPVDWGREKLQVAGKTYPAGDHAPAFIRASPLAGATDRYLVVNSGHTFHEKEFAALNYLLFPRLGDWAVMRVGADAKAWTPGAGELPEQPVEAGYFDEEWRAPVGGR